MHDSNDFEPSENFSRDSLLTMGFLVEGGLFVIALLLGRVLERWPLDWSDWNLEAFGWGIVGTLPLLVLLFVINHFPVGPLKELKSVVDRALIPVFEKCTILDFVIIAALAGLGEEALFRGVLQPIFTDWLGVWTGIIVVSLLFGLAHAITPTYVVLAAVMGIYLGWIYQVTGNLFIVVVVHGLYDFIALVYLVKILNHNKASSIDADS